jgi:hypothetical protein
VYDHIQCPAPIINSSNIKETRQALSRRRRPYSPRLGKPSPFYLHFTMPAISESDPTTHTPERRKGGGGKGSGGGGKGGGGSGGGGGKSGGGGGSSSSGGKCDSGGSLTSAHASCIQGPARQRPSRAATRRRGRRKPSDSARALALVRASMHPRTALAAAESTPLGPAHHTQVGSTEVRRG